MLKIGKFDCIWLSYFILTLTNEQTVTQTPRVLFFLLQLLVLFIGFFCRRFGIDRESVDAASHLCS